MTAIRYSFFGLKTIKPKFWINFPFQFFKCCNLFSSTYDDCQKNNSQLPVGVWSRTILFAFLVGQAIKQSLTAGQGFCFSALANSESIVTPCTFNLLI